MTLTDETLVRDLAELTDRAVPPMTLDPAAVLDAGRRHRRRRTVGSASVGLLAVAAAAVAAAQLGTGPGPVTPPAAATAELTKGLVATAANDADVVDSGDADTLSLTDGAEHHYTVRFDPVAGVVDAFEGGVAGAQGDDGWLGGFSAGADPADEGDGILQASGLAGDALLVAGYVSGPGEVRLEWSGDGPTLALDVPTFAVPGAAGRVYVMRIEGAALDGKWPTVTVVHSGKDEHRADVPLTPLKEHAAAADGPVVTVAEGVIEADSSAGPVFDLGVPVRNDFARMMADGEREELTYAILLTTVGEMAAGAEVSLTPEEAAGDAVLLAGLRPFGALVPMSSSDLGTTRAAKDAGPILQAGLSTHDVNALGMLPAGSRATVVLVVERAGGTERVPVPTFRVPGVDEDFFFVALHDDGVDLADWPSVYVEVTDQDGTVTLRSLPGVQAVAVSPSPTDDPVASDSG